MHPNGFRRLEMNVEVRVESLFESLVLDVNTRIVSYTYTIPFTSSQLK